MDNGGSVFNTALVPLDLVDVHRIGVARGRHITDSIMPYQSTHLMQLL